MKHGRFAFKDRAALEHKIEELHLDIPLADDISILFSPIVVAGRTLPSRFVIHPLEGADSRPDGGPSELTFRRYRRFARGGASIIWFEATAVTEAGRSNPRQLWLRKKTQNGFKRLVDETRQAALKKFGTHYVPLLILQITHSGRFSKPKGKSVPVIAQHNPILDSLMKLPQDYPLITDEELDRLQENFVTAARFARAAGFDGIDLKACHGYLGAELLACFKRQNSRYGGPLENRIRFLVETAEKIRKQVPGIFLSSRLSVYDSVPWPYGFGVSRQNEEKDDLREPKILVKKLAEMGFPLISLSAGIPKYRPHYGRPFDIPVRGMSLPDEHPLVGVSRLLRMTAELQQSFPGLPIVGTGYSWLRHFFPNAASAMVQTGRASFVGVGRLALAYPDFADDLARGGVLDPKKACTACSQCSELLRHGGPVGCTIRGAKIYAAELRRARSKS